MSSNKYDISNIVINKFEVLYWDDDTYDDLKYDNSIIRSIIKEINKQDNISDISAWIDFEVNIVGKTLTDKQAVGEVEFKVSANAGSSLIKGEFSFKIDLVATKKWDISNIKIGDFEVEYDDTLNYSELNENETILEKVISTIAAQTLYLPDASDFYLILTGSSTSLNDKAQATNEKVELKVYAYADSELSGNFNFNIKLVAPKPFDLATLGTTKAKPLFPEEMLVADTMNNYEHLISDNSFISLYTHTFIEKEIKKEISKFNYNLTIVGKTLTDKQAVGEVEFKVSANADSILIKGEFSFKVTLKSITKFSIKNLNISNLSILVHNTKEYEQLLNNNYILEVINDTIENNLQSKLFVTPKIDYNLTIVGKTLTDKQAVGEVEFKVTATANSTYIEDSFTFKINLVNQKINKLYVLGDSLSDAGNMYNIMKTWTIPTPVTGFTSTGGRIGADPVWPAIFYDKSWTNGLTAARVTAKNFNVPLTRAWQRSAEMKKEKEHGENYAVGGSTILSTWPITAIPDKKYALKAQSDWLIKEHGVGENKFFQSNDLVFIVMGGNDIKYCIEANRKQHETKYINRIKALNKNQKLLKATEKSRINNLAFMGRIIDQMVNEMINTIKKLIKHNVKHIFVGNIPNLARTPRYSVQENAIKDIITKNLCVAYNQKLSTKIISLQHQLLKDQNTKDVKIKLYDLANKIRILNQNWSTTIGEENWKHANTASISYNDALLLFSPDVRYVNGATEQNWDKRFWFDDIHPSAAVHEIIGNDMTDKIKEWFEPRL